MLGQRSSGIHNSLNRSSQMLTMKTLKSTEVKYASDSLDVRAWTMPMEFELLSMGFLVRYGGFDALSCH